MRLKKGATFSTSLRNLPAQDSTACRTGNGEPKVNSEKHKHGFTLIELLVVMLIIAMLITIAAPRYVASLDKSKETALKQTLAVMRDALDKYYGDNGKYPDDLNTLVVKRYLRSMPRDPITDSISTWTTIPPENPDKGAVYEIHSGSAGKGRDGTRFQDW
jgi:general secretion pathway protein G